MSRSSTWKQLSCGQGFTPPRVTTVMLRRPWRKHFSLPCEQNDRHSEAKCYIEQATIDWRQGDYAAAQKGYLAALASHRQGDDYREDYLDVVSEAHYGLGLVYRQQSRYEEARSHLQQALATAERLGDLQYEARALNALGSVANLQRDYSWLRRSCLPRHWKSARRSATAPVSGPA